MRIDNNGNYLDEDIDILIAEASSFRDTLHAILRRDPDYIDTIMDANYRDFVTYKWLMFAVFHDLDRIMSCKLLDATKEEMAEAAGQHPYLVD